MEVTHQFCDVCVPAPLDRPFTYRIPATLRHRLRRGCRVLVPFGNRKLVGVVVSLSATGPGGAKELLKLLDEVPIFDEELIRLAEWISGYYCVPLGEIFKVMAPAGGQIRKTTVYTLTETGKDVAARLSTATEKDATLRLLEMLERRALSEAYLKTKVPDAPKILSALEKRGWVTAEEDVLASDPLRAPSDRLLVSFTSRPSDVKLNKAERELLSYLELHPGSHVLRLVEEAVPGAGTAARRLARRGLLRLERAPLTGSFQVREEAHRLTQAQEEACKAIRQALSEQRFQTFLLHGVTGSGKTEVYLRAIDACLAGGKSAMLLVPEIALTPAVAAQFAHRFGSNVAILHSAFQAGERAAQWQRIREGTCRVVVATRSGVFAPLRNLGLILVDEEHDRSYKQEETPRYHGRDVAIVRAQMADAVAVLGSATPSVESRFNAERGKYALLELPERVAGRPMAQVEVVDMREEFLQTRSHNIFSRRLLEALKDRLERGEQAILLLNRRGFSSFVTCRKCGWRMECPNCSITLTYHRRHQRMLCHYCNAAEPPPSVCAACGSEYIQFLGAGSERVESDLHQAFPAARIARLDRDTVAGKRTYESILSGFRQGAYDILVGTQMIAKGHDVPNVTLVGVVSADIGLGMPDFRAAERTFQLLTQVAGRAGRGDLPGLVILQTLNPDHYAVRFASEQDYARFYEREIVFRKMMRYPPFSALANVLVRSERQEVALGRSMELGELFEPPLEGLMLLGPAEAPLERLRAEYRYQILLKAASRHVLRQALARIREHMERQHWPAGSVIIDVDPQSLL